MATEAAARFFVNSGIVSSRVDMYHLLRPMLKQTVSYRYLRGGGQVSHGTGWVERIVADRPEVSSFFTPLSICVNVDSWEHLEFETRADQLLTYTLVQGNERVVLEFAPMVHGDEEAAVQQPLPLVTAPEYVQMELAALHADEGDAPESDDEAGRDPRS